MADLQRVRRDRVAGTMKKRITITNTPTRINIGNLVQRLRRMRTELAMMLAQVDEALERIDGETTNA